MYNEAQKSRFIHDYAKSENGIRVCVSTFKSIEPFEKQWNADICTKSAEEAKEAIDAVTGIVRNFNSTRTQVLRKYIQWCLDNNIPNASDDILKLKIIGLDVIKKKMVSNPKMLSRRLELIFGAEDRQGINNIYKAYYWLSFMGVPDTEILNITADEVIFEEMMVRHNNTNYPIYFESIPVFKACVNNEAFLFNHAVYTSSPKPRAPGNILLRGFTNPKKQSFKTVLSRYAKKKQTDIKLNYSGVYRSGMFYRKYQDEVAGYPIDFYSEAKEMIMSSERATVTNRRICSQKLEFHNDYNRWKLAFNLG